MVSPKWAEYAEPWLRIFWLGPEHRITKIMGEGAQLYAILNIFMLPSTLFSYKANA